MDRRGQRSGAEKLAVQVGEEVAAGDPQLTADPGGTELATLDQAADGLGRDPEMSRSVGYAQQRLGRDTTPALSCRLG
jgi:hypothetical protein